MTQPTQPASFVEIAARKRESIAYLLIALGVVMLALTIFWAMRWNSARHQKAPEPKPAEVIQPEEQPPEPATTDRGDYLPTAIWGGMVAVLLLGTGGFSISRKPPAGREIYEARLLLMIVGGAAGLLTALLGFVFAWRWQDELVRWVNLGATGGAKWVVAALAIFLAGLAVMFFSVQLARAEERNDVILRRVLYGSNAVLTGLLMLLLLAVVNIIVFLKLPDNVISTAAGFKGLSDPSKEFLKTITDDVNVYLIMPENASVQITRSMSYNGLYGDCRALLSACQAQNSHIKVVPLSPVTDGDEIRATMKRLKVPENQIGQYGMLIGYGKSEEQSAFLPLRDLHEITPEGVLVFEGENRLMTELSFLSEGGQRPVVYFTQSNDEPAISDTGGKKIRTMRVLAEHLRERKYEVRPLVFERGKKPNLADAALVVVVAPRVPFEQEHLDILAEYLKPKPGVGPGGKLVAFLPAFPEVGGTAVSKTGLEPLLNKYGVHVSEKLRLFTLPSREHRFPYLVAGTITPESRGRDNPVSSSLDENSFIPFGNVRPVSADRDAARSGNIVMNVLASRSGRETYRDDRFNSNPLDVADQIYREAQIGSNQTIREKLVTGDQVPFGVYVGQQIEDGRGLRVRPKLLVVGTDWLASDEALSSTRIPHEYIRLTGNMLDFMREKPRGMNIEPRELGTYNLPKDPDGVSLLILPIGLVVLGILGLGVGVWVTRRR